MFGEMSYNCGLNLLYEEYFSKPNVSVVRKKIFEEGAPTELNSPKILYASEPQYT
jgi:hypothetical protein